MITDISAYVTPPTGTVTITVPLKALKLTDKQYLCKALLYELGVFTKLAPSEEMWNRLHDLINEATELSGSEPPAEDPRSATDLLNGF